MPWALQKNVTHGCYMMLPSFHVKGWLVQTLHNFACAGWFEACWPFCRVWLGTYSFKVRNLLLPRVAPTAHNHLYKQNVVMTERFLSMFYRHLWNSRIQTQIPTSPYFPPSSLGQSPRWYHQTSLAPCLLPNWLGRNRSRHRQHKAVQSPLRASKFKCFPPAHLRRNHIASPLNRAKAMSLFSGDNELLGRICWFREYKEWSASRRFSRVVAVWVVLHSRCRGWYLDVSSIMMGEPGWNAARCR